MGLAKLKYLAEAKRKCAGMSRDELVDLVAFTWERLDEIVAGLKADEKRLEELRK
jgi:hypothetical protein